MRADVVVVGAGAAGITAATVAAKDGARVLLLEKNSRPGLKILISGGGRCNLTTTRSGRDLEAQYGQRRGRFLRHALRSFPPAALCALVEECGVPLREEDLEKIFPVSGRARDVLDALLSAAAAAGAELVRECAVTGLRAEGPGFELDTTQGACSARAVVLATGGLSYPRTGATGDGYGFCREFGHRIVDPVPALAPLWVEEEWVRSLAGLVVTPAIAAVDADGKVRCTRQRPVLFTHKGLSGPGAMDVSGSIEECGGGTVRLDFAPELNEAAVRDALVKGAQRQGRRAVRQALPRGLPDRLRAALCARAGADGALAELRRDAREALVRSLKATQVPVPRSLGFAHAEVTRGGVDLTEVDPKTMQSRLHPGLFICGELLDLDGPIGGFNFQAAFATARLAGLAAVRPRATD